MYSGLFFGGDRAGVNVSQAPVSSRWLRGMMCGLKNAYDCIKAFSETDVVEDLKGIDLQIISFTGMTTESCLLLPVLRKASKLFRTGP